MTKCYTFYSYKGGSGRSTTSVNTVKHLIGELGANKDHPILIVDADLESAGLTYFFGCENKFTDWFTDSIHTTKLFTQASSALDGENADLIFGVDDPDAFSPVSSNNAICDALKKKFNPEDVDAALKGLELLSSETDLLYRIVRVNFENNPTTVQQNIKKSYKVESFISELGRIERDASRSVEKKKEDKLRAMRAFLPASGFVDVSERFGVEEGTVKFLGADVHYEGAQILQSENTVDAIRELQYLCNSHGYAAIVFDSGAGVQSSAAALQETSHVLIYCMRPTVQFRHGTRTQIANYKKKLEEALELNMADGEVTEDSKIVILLPTAVPMSSKNSEWVDEAFKGIRGIVTAFPNLIDGSFCTKDDCLNEVELFKWKEEILLSKKGTEDKKDEDRAFDVYRRLAQKIVEFSGGF